MGYSSFSMKFLTVSEWIMKFAVTNILWLLFNFPILYLVLTALYANTFEKLQLIVITIAILAPFILFPATVAMFGVVRDWLLAKKGVTLFSSYWNYYKENYLRSLLGGLVIVPIWSGWVFNFVSSAVTIGSLSFYFYVVVTMFLFTFTMHFFSDTVHFQVKFKDSLVKSIFMTIGNPHYTILIPLLSGMLIYLAFDLFIYIIPFCIGSVSAYLAFFGYHRIILKAQSRMGKIESSDDAVANS